jgi:hypothetical protein
MPSGHGNWTVSNDGCGGGDGFEVAVVIVAACAAVVAAVSAVVWFVTAYAVALAACSAGAVVVLAVSTWLLRRYLTVLYYNPAALAEARARQKPKQVTTTMIHRHLIEYVPAPAAIENQNHVVTAAVLAAAHETEEIPR